MTSTRHLGQVVAIQQDVSTSSMARLTKAYHALDVPNMFDGMRGDYDPIGDAETDKLPPEGNEVQATVDAMFTAAREALTDLFDITAARDFTNSSGNAVADVVVGESVLVKGASMPYLLWLGRQLDHINTFVERIPTHAPDTTWSLHESRGVWVSAPVRRLRTVKVPKVVQLAPATPQHAAQVQMFHEDVPHGTWNRVRYTGAIPVERKETLLRRINTLRAALHVARGVCNMAEAVDPKPGARILGYLFDE